jgi:outer membrane protein TolC
LEEVSKAAIEQSAKKKVLPTVSYTGRLEERDNYRWAYSDTMANQGFQGGTSDGVASMSTGSERTNFTQTLEAGWSPTDAALNFYMARSGGNDRLKAHYQRVRVAQQLVGKVDAAYYRLLSLQEALPFARRLTAVRNSVDGAMRELHGKQLKEMADFHRVREKSIRAEQELVALQAELERQRDVLATALGISPESCMDGGFYVCGVIAKPCFSGKMCDLEMVAIRNRPEAYQAGLDNLNSVNDLKRTVIRHFPTMRTYWRFSWDKSKYILEKDWRDVGVTVSFDLVQWLANRDENKSAAANVARTDREMANIAVGITSQVRIAALKYYEAMETVRNSERFLANTRALVKDAEVRAERDKLDELAFSELKGDVLSERVRNIRAIGEANATLAELQAAMGTNYSEPVDCK